MAIFFLKWFRSDAQPFLFYNVLMRAREDFLLLFCILKYDIENIFSCRNYALTEIRVFYVI